MTWEGGEAPECLWTVTTIGCFTDIGGCEETPLGVTTVTRGRGSHDTGTRATSDIVTLCRYGRFIRFRRYGRFVLDMYNVHKVHEFQAAKDVQE